MPPGIRATVEFSTPDICPITELSEAAETTIDSVTANVCPPDCTESVTEFSMDTDGDSEVDIPRIFSHGSVNRYRLSHDDGLDCPCELLGEFGCPAARYVAREGTLTLVFHVREYDQLQEVVTELRDQFSEVNIRRFVRAPAEEQSRDSTLVDRSRLTRRQLEVLETAHERGYFDRPRQANATEIAAELDISPSTFREHLTAAESKILDDLL